MEKVSLRTYDHEIEGLIEKGVRLDEAISHCHHILLSFPKHLETYRVLGKAYLEARGYDEAVDIFQRVLMAAPGDFVAHVGLSIIADEQGKLDEAFLHMERAFEVQPSNAAIQGELKRLTGRRDGVEPPKIRLTRGALARMYVQGNLHSQAITEIRGVLNNDPTRSDMQILMAQAYFRNGQNTEATQVCTELLLRFPDCLDANRLMVEMLPGTLDAASVSEYRRRVNELDPYAAFVKDSVFDSDKVPEDAVTLEKLVYNDQTQVRAEVLGIALESEANQSGRKSEQPDHLQDSPSPNITEGPLSDQEVVAASQSIEEPPAMIEAGEVAETEVRETFASGTSTSDTPTSSAESEQVAVEGNLPDWVKDLAPKGERASATQPVAPITKNPPEISDTPQWLQNSAGEQPPAADLNPEETPHWINTLGSNEPDEPTAESKAKSDATWLNNLRSDQQSQPEVPSIGDTGLEASQADSLDWLKDFDNNLEKPVTNTGEAPIQTTPETGQIEPEANLGLLGTTGQEQDETMPGLDDLVYEEGTNGEGLATDSNAESDSAMEQVDETDGLSKPEQQLASILPDSSVMDTGIEKEDTPIMDESGSSDWLSSEGQKPSPIEEVPDWVHTPSAVTDLAMSTAQPPPDPGSESVEDLPPWLAGLEKEDVSTSAVSAASDDLPSWLQSEVEPEPQTTKRTLAADWQPLHHPVESKPVPVAPDENANVEEVSTPAVPVAQPVIASAASDIPPIPTSTIAPETSTERIAMEASQRAETGLPLEDTTSAGSVFLDASSLSGAQSELERGNISEALMIYERLIRKGKSLEEIIRDLRDAQLRYPVDVPILQALGDAYMRANRLQEALDAYTKAEELLR